MPKMQRGRCPKCGYETAITKNGKWVRHAAARGGWRTPGGGNICPNSGRSVVADEMVAEEQRREIEAEERRRLENEEMERHFREHPHG